MHRPTERRSRSWARVAGCAVLVAGVTSCSGPAAGSGQPRNLPSLGTSVAMTNLDVPWDIAVLPDGAWLVTERDRQEILLRRPNADVRVLADHPSGFWSTGETGLMSIAADPRVSTNSRFYTCTGFNASGTPDIRVIAWKLNATRTAAHRVDTLLKGIHIQAAGPTPGRHGGCRLRFSPNGALYVGTGDAAIGTNSQNLHSLNGKVLRMNRFTGRPWPSNPWANAPNRHRRYLYTYGHRNVQGLASRPGGGMWSVEHGPDRDDEVNRLVGGGNYGWNPVPGYNESVPMTDYSLPGRQIGARWSSGFPTLATSGAVWVRGAEWEGYRGTLAVCALKASRLLFMRFDRSGHLVWVRAPTSMRQFGRLRSVVQARNGDLLVTTSNGGGGGGGDVIVRVHPR